MGPHDLLCKWCSTFVGKDKSFCSIFCESRFTRSKRRKLPYKRPVKSSGADGYRTEFVSPRTNNTAPAKKEFLEDVMTAMKMNSDRPSPERDKQRPGAVPKANTVDDLKLAKEDKDVPKLDLSLQKETTSKLPTDKSEMSLSLQKERTNKLATDKSELNLKKLRKSVDILEAKSKQRDKHIKPADNKASTGVTRPENLKSKTHTIIKHRTESKIPVANNTATAMRMEANKRSDKQPDEQYNLVKAHSRIDTGLYKKSKPNDDQMPDEESPDNSGDLTKSLALLHTKAANELSKRVRSSGYGAPVDPKLRPMALKPRSATHAPKPKRESSAKSSKSFTSKPGGVSLPDLVRETSRPIVNKLSDSKWELIPEETSRTVSEQEQEPVRSSLENEQPSSAISSTTVDTDNPSPNSPSKTERKNDSTDRSGKVNTVADTSRTEFNMIHEILREESTGSEILDQSVLQERLSSIKRKVEVRRRGRDSRSSVGSDLDSSFDCTERERHTPRGGIRYEIPESTERHCLFCYRPLYSTDRQFCGGSCETRKRQLSWKSANIVECAEMCLQNLSNILNCMSLNIVQKLCNGERLVELPRQRRNQYAWSLDKNTVQHPPNYANYVPSWGMYG